MYCLRTKLVRHESSCLPHFEHIVERHAFFKFLTKSKDFLSKQPEHVFRLDDASKLYQELGFPRGRKVFCSIQRHPLLFKTYRHDDSKMWFGFTDFMETLLQEEKSILESMEIDKVTTVRKLLMMSAKKRIPWSKIYHCRSLFGIAEDFRDQIVNYPNYFKIVVEDDGKRVFELVNWDPLLAVSVLKREFMLDEDRVKKAFKFLIKHGKSLDLDEDYARKLNLLNTLSLVSLYSDRSELDLWTLEVEKYRVGLLHEFLSLTLEKRASIHHIEGCCIHVSFRSTLSAPNLDDNQLIFVSFSSISDSIFFSSRTSSSLPFFDTASSTSPCLTRSFVGFL